MGFIEADATVVYQAHQRRRYKREDLCFKTRFSVLVEDEAQGFLERLDAPAPAHAHIHTDTNEHAGIVYTENLSSGGLGLRGKAAALKGQGLKAGDFLRMEIRPPRTDVSVRCLGRVAWIRIHETFDVFTAGVAFVAVNPDDLNHVRGLT